MSKLLGFRVRDSITGFEGIALHYKMWLNGCNQYSVEGMSKIDDVERPPFYSFDEQQLEKLSAEPIIHKMDVPETDIQMQDIVEHKFTKLRGTVVGIAITIEGTKSVCIQRKTTESGRVPQSVWENVLSLDIIEKHTTTTTEKRLTGGPSTYSEYESKL